MSRENIPRQDSPDTLKTLVIVPGHASFKREINPENLPSTDDILQDGNFALQPFQKGEPPFYIDHMRAGIELSQHLGNQALLVPSGGFTRHESVIDPNTVEGTSWSEAATYHAAAERLGLWLPGVNREIGKAATMWVQLDEYARDSFENILGGVHAFWELAGRFPDRVVIVGWAFKEERFRQHASALGISRSKIDYHGVNNPPENDLPGAERGEAATRAAFLEDPFGERGDLAKKRLERDVLSRGVPFGNMPRIQM